VPIEVTVAVNVTGVPNTVEAAEDVTAVLVTKRMISVVESVHVAPLKLASPL